MLFLSKHIGVVGVQSNRTRLKDCTSKLKLMGDFFFREYNFLKIRKVVLYWIRKHRGECLALPVPGCFTLSTVLSEVGLQEVCSFQMS